MILKRRLPFVVAKMLILTMIISAQAPRTVRLSPAPEFVPDWTFSGSALTGWQPIGDAAWKAQDGESTGTPSGKGGGWLMLDKSFQDVQFFSRIKCDGTCDAGVLFRVEK